MRKNDEYWGWRSLEMQIRTATPEDIPSIVALLKRSLGESLMPKSETYWRWKHVDNPFGNSPVLLAFDGDLLVGVRAFMQWEWTSSTGTQKAVRAVDTATHPEHQGKGIFKKLTLGLLENCKNNQVQFVFNTPNNQSKPGYIKMGWKEVGKFPIRFHVRRPLGILFSIFKKASYQLPLADQSVTTCLAHPGLQSLIDKHRAAHAGKCITNHTLASLVWRYQDVPVVNYHACVLGTTAQIHGVAFYRFKVTRLGIEMRIADVFISDASRRQEMQALLLEKAAVAKAHYLTVAGVHHEFKFKGILSTPKLNTGPIVTVREVNDRVPAFRDFSAWSPSIGDLELF